MSGGQAFAPNDFISSLAITIGFRDWAYRRRAVDLLQLAKGDRVLEIGCGTGRNFPLLERAVGPAGTVIALDISEKMLDQSRRRAARHGWSNIEFVEADVGKYEFTGSVDGVLSTYALVVVPEYDRVLENAFRALRVGKRCVILDQKLPSGAAARLVPLLNFLSRPLDYSGMLRERHLWESIQHHSGNLLFEERYLGFIYLAAGEKKAAPVGDRAGQG